MRFCKVQLVVLVSTLVGYTLGDPTDWVSVEYVIMKGQPASRATGKSLTSDAEATIVRNADSTGTKGPYSIVNSKDVLPPSKDPHDYLSWAPYHWPDCNWCANKQKRLAYAPDTSKNGTYDDNSGKLHSNPDELEHGPSAGDQIRFMPFPAVLDVDSTRRDDSGNSNPPDSTQSATTNLPGDVAAPISLQIPTATSSTPKTTSSLPDSTGVQPSQTPIQDGHRPGPAQAAKTTKCTPSPTKSLAPSATWTTCPYVVRDGDVNPDVRTLNGPDAINSLSQNVLFQALASILSKDGSSYAKTAAAWIDAFFITASTKMNPNLNFGQIVRGPGPDGQKGTFTGVLDLRGMVKVCNAIQLLKAGGSSVWTKVRDDAMSAWLSKYSKWLDTSEIGQKAASRPNNHGTFFVNQVVSAKIYSGDTDGAKATLKTFFDGIFMDQLAKSGEQPFEAVRTRPYHYRCFNLEALITNAKLGDQLGHNFWSAQSKYGATIQTALDFILKTDPKSEDISQVYPHVAAIIAAYGDPDGKYTKFLNKNEPNYRSKSYFFYDQPAALPNAPGSSKKRSLIWEREDSTLSRNTTVPNTGTVRDFECPKVFADAMEVEIEDGLFVTCRELQPLYEAVPEDTPTLGT